MVYMRCILAARTAMSLTFENKDRRVIQLGWEAYL
jgi:hypothetical protein